MSTRLSPFTVAVGGTAEVQRVGGKALLGDLEGGAGAGVRGSLNYVHDGGSPSASVPSYSPLVDLLGRSWPVSRMVMMSSAEYSVMSMRCL